MNSEKNKISLNSYIQKDQNLASILLAPVMNKKDIEEIQNLREKTIKTNEKAEIIWIDESIDTQDKNNLNITWTDLFDD